MPSKLRDPHGDDDRQGDQGSGASHDFLKGVDSNYPTVKNSFDGLIELNILKPHRMETKEKLFVYGDYLEVLKRGT